MRVLGLLLVASFVGLCAQVGAPAQAAPNHVSAAKTLRAKADAARHEAAKSKRAIERQDRNKQTTTDSVKNTNAIPDTQATTEDICRAVTQAAADNQLPVSFFVRVIWKESGFNSREVSRKGAKGIAQFMPETADLRGLVDPFDPISSIKHAARYLAELRDTFGNLGLAAAGYNAGPGRVRQWIDRKVALPKETRNYVAAITGLTAAQWTSSPPPKAADMMIPQDVPCASLTRAVIVAPLHHRWGIAACRSAHLTANWSKARAWPAQEPVAQEQVVALIADRERIMRLHERFRNFGLAAVCYDPRRAREWLAGKGAPVSTGRIAETTVSSGPLLASATHLALAPPKQGQHAAAEAMPKWGAQLTANWSETGAWATYRALQKQFAALIGEREPIVLHGVYPGMGAAPRYMIRIADDSREYLERLCNKLIAAGGACVVLRNEPSLSVSPPSGKETGKSPPQREKPGSESFVFLRMHREK